MTKQVYLKNVFGKVDFREDEKKEKRKRERTFWRVFGWEMQRRK